MEDDEANIEETYRSEGTTKPFDFVHKSIGENVNLVLKDGRKIDGVLVGYDLELNLVLEKASIISPEMTKKMGFIIVRRNNILAIGDNILV